MKGGIDLLMLSSSSIFSILAISFAEKNIIHQHMDLKIPYSAFIEDQSIVFEGYVEGGHSFVVRNKNNDIIGVCMNNDTKKRLKQRPSTSIFAIFGTYHRFLKSQTE